MRILLIIVAVLAAFWSGYWFIGSTTKEAVLSSWLDDRKTEGWAVEYASFDVVGFPNRFDSRFEDITLADPQAGWSWQAPFFNILALSYQPNHIITVWPHTQVIGLPREDVTITSDEMIASVVFEPDTKLALDRSALRTTNLALRGSAGWSMRSDSFNFSTRQNDAVPLAHTLFFDATNLTPTQAFKANVDPANLLPVALSRVVINTDITYDAPWDRIAVESGLPRAQQITLNNVSAAWGPLGVRATGTLDVDTFGELNGKITLEITNWRGVLSLGVSSGLFNQTVAEALETGLSLLTVLSEDPTKLDASLTFSDGKLSLGPIPLGDAPRLKRR